MACVRKIITPSLLTLLVLLTGRAPLARSTEPVDGCGLRQVLQSSGLAPAKATTNPKLDVTLPDVSELQARRKQISTLTEKSEIDSALRELGAAFDQKVRDVLGGLQESSLSAAEKARLWNRWAKNFTKVNPTWGMSAVETEADGHLFIGRANAALLIDAEGNLHRAKLTDTQADGIFRAARGDAKIPDTLLEPLGFQKMGARSASTTASNTESAPHSVMSGTSANSAAISPPAPQIATLPPANTLQDLQEKMLELRTMSYKDYTSSTAFADAMKTKSDEFDRLFHSRVREVLDSLQDSKLPASEKARVWNEYADAFHSLKRTWNMSAYHTSGGQHLYLGTKDYLLVIDPQGTLYKVTADPAIKARLKRGITDAEVDAFPKTRIEPKPKN